MGEENKEENVKGTAEKAGEDVAKGVKKAVKAVKDFGKGVKDEIDEHTDK